MCCNRSCSMRFVNSLLSTMSASSPPSSEQELQTKAMAELSSLGRVSHKLAMTDAGDPLERVLNLLLPRLLTRIGSNHAMEQQTTDRALKETLSKIHAKLVEMMSHIMKRVRADQQCKLPCLAVLNLLYQDNKPTDVDPFTINLTLAFLNLGLPRCTLQEAESLLPGLLVLVGTHSGLQSQTTPARKAQSHQVCHLLLRVVERMVQEERQSLQTVMAPSLSTLSGAKVQEPPDATAHGNIMDRARRLCRDDETIASSVYDLFLDVILYQPSPSKTMPPPGMSQAGHERLISGVSHQAAKDWAAEMAPQSRLKEFKLAMLSFIVPSRKWALFMNTTDKGISRTVALLVAAMGDAHPHVAERASLALKAHLDSMRERNETTQAIAALGDPMALSCSLLSLVLGDGNAQSALSQISAEKEQLTLGRTVPVNAQRPQLVLSLKRRMVSEQTAAASMSFVSQKVLDDNPQLLGAIGPVMTRALSTLAVLSAGKLLSTTGTSTLSTLRAAPYTAAAQLLNALSLRLVTLDDPPVDLLAKSLSTVCLVLAQASTPRPAAAAGTFEGSIAMRDACYGAVCSLSRSLHGESFIFSCGATTMGVSIDTATLLFGCAANEEETLRPRAVAALDALLGAYCRVYAAPTLRKTEPSTAMYIDGESNPWSQATTVSDAKLPVASVGDFCARNSDGLARALIPLLWSAAQSSQPKASRVAASRWSSDLLKTLDLPSSCHILCFLAGDPDVTAASIARDGLGLDKRIGEPYDEQDHSNYTLPDFSDLTMVFSQKSDMNVGRSTSSWRPRYFDFSYNGKAAALRFGLACLLSDLYGGEDDAVAAFVNALSETLAHFGTASNGRGSAHGRESIDLLDECAICLTGCLSTSRFARDMILSGRSSFGLPDMESLALSADSSKARRYLAEACGHIYEDVELWQSAPDVNVELDEWVEKCQIERPLHQCLRTLTAMQNEPFLVGEVHGAAFLGARCSRAFRLMASRKGSSASSSSLDTCWDSVNKTIAALAHGIAHSDEIIGNAFSQGLSILLSYDGVDAPILDPRIYAGTTSTLTQLDLALRKYGNGDHTDSTRSSVLAHAAGIVLAATTSAAGYVSIDSTNSAANRSVGPARIQCVDALFSLIGSMAFRKDPEVSLVAGEALADYADAYSPHSAVWSSSATDWPDLYSDEYANALPPHQQVLYILLEREMKVSSPHKRTACAPALLALVGRASRMANANKELTKRALVVEIVQRLADVQSAFITLLADPKSKQLTRESCCLGLAACQGLAQAVSRADEVMKISLSEELNDSLLHAFGQTTNFGGSALMESRSQNRARRRQENQESETASALTESFGIEAEVGGAAGLGEAALGAYREMAAAALALGRSDVLYALLLLSISHPVWFTPGPRDRYSASSLLGENSLVGSRTNSAEMREALRPHLSKLIPRLLRACHDPNKQTREQMNTLWIGMTGGGAESRSAITEHLLPTIDILIEDTSNKLWRARVGACGALAEVIVGRTWDELGGGSALLEDDDVFIRTSTFSTSAAVRLLRLWRVAMRALDDVRITVRESGESLVRSVRSLTIRLCDPSAHPSTTNGAKPTIVEQKKAEEASRAAAATALRWLVKHGLNQPCAEGIGACVSCLLGIVDVVQPVTLQPVLSELIGALLMAMSGLEPAALNYLQVRTAGQESGAESYDRLERARLQMVQSGPIAGAVNKCLEMIPSVELSAQKDVVPQLDSALRCAVGFATRAATADAVSTLCTACPGAFSFPGHSTTNPTVRLLRALYFASEREHGQGARDKMAHALGNLAAISPGQSVRSLALRACERYGGATGNNDDPAARRAAAMTLRALAVRASNQLADGGPQDVWCRRVLPMSFLGLKDTDTKVASLWKEVWDEGGHAVDAPSRGSSNFGVLLEEKLLPYLVRACINALDDVSWSRRIAACTALIELCDQNVLAPVPRSTQSSIEASQPSELSRSKRRAVASLAALQSCIKLMVRPRVWAGKANVVKAAVQIVGQWAIVCSENDPVALGWEQANEICPWMPVCITQENFGRDLFTGDRWFERRNPETESPDIAYVPPDSELDGNADIEMDDTEEEAKIDFEECDNILASDVETEERPGSDDLVQSLMFSGLCRALLEQSFPSQSSQSSATDDILPYRAASLAGLAELLQVLNNTPDMDDSLVDHQMAVYRMIAPTMLAVIDAEKQANVTDQKTHPPLIIARSIDCLSCAMWKGIGSSSEQDDVLLLSETLRAAGGSPAWTVRASSVKGSASLASKCTVQALRNHRTMDVLLESSKRALGDRKFWRVRYAGLELLLALVKRAGECGATFSIVKTASSDSRRHAEQLALEALLPYKETILRLARSTLTDSESKVTALASEVCSAMAWWP